ncbi:nuclear pore complex protein Nup50 [Petaurus breviceps papuanus]|uniref:nuclear pore complex protein Nup50 n=1 Tax=Petaurus breviceps papuanus TaxID=3040969 RepID=UPI0036DB33E4
MAKRNAEKELTDRNWDQEDDVEEVGTFSVASEEVLRNRAIKKAKRRGAASEPESAGAFRGFKGLLVPPGRGGGGLFGNGAGIKPLDGLSNGGSASATSALALAKAGAEKKVTFGLGVANGPMSTMEGDKKAANAKTNGDSPQPSSSGRGASAYHRQLAALNCSVRDWIVKHVDTNPLCDLTPIFKKLRRFLTGIEQLSGSDGGSEREATGQLLGGVAGPAAPAPCQQPRDAPFVFDPDKGKGAADKQAEAPPEKKTTSFHFGRKVDSSVLGPLGTSPMKNFSFSSGNTGIFGKDLAQPSPVSSFTKMPESHPDGSAAESKGAEEEDSEEPPKAVVTEVKEEDAFYSKKCKLFYKKDNEFKEKGVGTLHLKPAANQKTQLLVRADTNLGNILLNVLVPPNMPCSRTGKNNVLIVCVPNPPISEKSAATPATMLIRVKTAEDADELHQMLLEKKGA